MTSEALPEPVVHKHYHTTFGSDCATFGCCSVFFVCCLVVFLATVDKLPW